MDNSKVIRALQKLGASQEAVEWVKAHGGASYELWRDCERGDWLWWLLRKKKMPEKNASVRFARWSADRAKKYAAAHAYAVADAAAAYVAYVTSYAYYAADDATSASADNANAAYAAEAAADNAAAAYAYIAADNAERRAQADYIRERFTCPL